MNHVDAFVERVEACEPELVGVVAAREQLPGGADTTVTHAGPSLEGALTDGPLLGAIVGGLAHEGWSLEDAREVVLAGELDLRPNQDNGRAAPLAGVITPSMPLLVVADRSTGATAHAPLNEGLGAVLRFGANGPEVLARLAWIRDVVGPALAAALDAHGPISLRPLLALGLRNGDELHNRNAATTAALVGELRPDLAMAAGKHAPSILEFLRTNDHTFLNISVAAAKCLLDATAAWAPAGVISAMGANGRAFGVKVSGLGDSWITAPAPAVHGRLDPGRCTADASPLLGDSCVIEAAGFGGFALAAAPEVASYLGCSQAELLRRTRAAWASTVAVHRSLTLPLEGDPGAPLGLDVSLALVSPVAPVIDAGIAHRRAGIGQIGAGVAEIPRACFQSAHDRLFSASLATAT